MNLIAEIILWVFSLVLAISSIFFSIRAAANSKAANEAVKNLIKQTRIEDESHKLFFDQLKQIILDSKKTIKILKGSPSYSDYSITASTARMIPLSVKIRDEFIKTEYKDITLEYINGKRELEKQYRSTMPDFKILREPKKIPVKKIGELLTYHKNVVDVCSLIIKKYSEMTSTSEI